MQNSSNKENSFNKPLSLFWFVQPSFLIFRRFSFGIILYVHYFGVAYGEVTYTTNSFFLADYETAQSTCDARKQELVGEGARCTLPGNDRRLANFVYFFGNCANGYIGDSNNCGLLNDSDYERLNGYYYFPHYSLGDTRDEKSNQCNATDTVGNPVSPVTGEKTQTEKLVALDALQPIILGLHYNSSTLSKWKHSYHRNLTFSAYPTGDRFDTVGTANGYYSPATPEVPQNFGGLVTEAGKPANVMLQSYRYKSLTKQSACENGWAYFKQQYYYSWTNNSVAQYQITPISSFGGVGQCYVYDGSDGNLKMVLDIYELFAGKPVDYENAGGVFLRFLRENGSVVVFSEYGGYLNKSKTGETLEVSGTGSDKTYRLHNTADEIEEYSSDGKLRTITSPQGHVQTLIYITDSVPGVGMLYQVINQTGESLTFAYEEYGVDTVLTRIKSITDYNNRQWGFNYDLVKFTLSSIDMPDGTQKQYHYEDANNVQLLTGITDERGNRYATWEYNDDGQVILSAHGINKNIDRVELNFLNDSRRRVIKKRTSTITSPVDMTSTYYTGAVSGSPTVFGVTGHDEISIVKDSDTGNVEYIDEKGQRTEYSNYDSKGNPGIIREAVNSSVQREKAYNYDSRYQNKISDITESSVYPGNQKITSYQYDDYGNNTSMTISGFRPDGTAVSQSTSFQYNGPYHQLTEIDGPHTDVSDIYTIAYYADTPSEGSNRARMKSVIAPLNMTLYNNITYTLTGKINTYLAANNIQTTFSYYFGNNRLQSLEQHDLDTGEKQRSEWTYLATGEVETVTTGNDVIGKTTLTFNYDDARRLTSIVDGIGNYIEYTLDSEGNIEQENIRDNVGTLIKQLTQTFDDYNRLQLSTQVNEQLTETWSADGTLDKIVDGKNVTTDYSYDNLRRLTEINQDMGGTSPQTANAITTLNYDIQGNLNYVKNSESGETIYTYDDLGNQLTRTSDDTGLTVYTHDAAGNITSMADANGEIFTNSYDALNRLTSVSTTNAADDHIYEYDTCVNGVGRLCAVTNASSTQRYTYDAFGGVASQQSLKYAYDSAGRLESVTYPSGARLIYGYDVAGQIDVVEIERNGVTVSLASNLIYDPFGDFNNLVYGNGLNLMQNKDTAYRSVSQTILNVFALDYPSYDANGNLTERIDTIPGSSSTYAYDEHNRLISANGDFGTRLYDYDKNANRESVTVDGIQTINAYVPQSNRLSMRGVDNAILDDNGNTLSIGDRSYSYTKHNRLFEVFENGVLKATYQYNSLGQRVSKLLPDGTGKYFLYDVDGKLMVETDINGNVLFEYFYLNGQLLAKYSPDTDYDGISNYEEDKQGSNPQSLDTDGDGLTDIDEMFLYGTAIHNVDTDGDGISDQEEIAFNSDPLNSNINLGDVNLDGEFNVGDYLLLVQYVTGSRNPTATQYQQGDLNQDGVLDVRDILLMQRALLGFQLSWFDHPIESLETFISQLYSQLISPAYAANGDGDIYYVHVDHLGTPLKMTNELGFITWQALYDPFGKAIVDEDVDGDGSDVEMNVRFPGQYYDEESELHYNYFRTYDPDLGRYITSDPIGLKGGLNTYGYVFGRPTRFIDPLGLGPVTGGVCGAIDLGMTLSGIHSSSNALTDALQPLRDQQKVLDKRISQCDDPNKEIKLRELRLELSDSIVEATREFALDNYSPADATILGGVAAAGCLGLGLIPIIP